MRNDLIVFKSLPPDEPSLNSHVRIPLGIRETINRNLSFHYLWPVFVPLFRNMMSVRLCAFERGDNRQKPRLHVSIYGARRVNTSQDFQRLLHFTSIS